MIASIPDSYTNIGNPLVIKVSGTGKQQITLSKDSSLSVKYNLFVETFGSVGSIDISQYVKSFFRKEETFILANVGSGGTPAYVNRMLCVPVWIDNSSTKRYYMRGMNFINEKKRSNQYTLLTCLSKIIRWENLERFVSFLPVAQYVSIDGEEFSINGNTNMSAVQSTADHISVNIAKDYPAKYDITMSSSPLGDNIITEDGRLTLDRQRNEIVTEGTTETMGTIKRYPIEIREIPEHPFYVRWTNRYGGYDYWMFSCVHQKEWEMTEQEVASKYYDDVTNASETITTFGSAYEHRVTAMAGSLNEEEFECIRDMMFADIIEVMTGINDSRYNKTWLRISLDKASIGKMSDTPRTDVELTFKIPIL